MLRTLRRRPEQPLEPTARLPDDEDDSVFPAWNGLLEGLLAVHDRFLRLDVRGRQDLGDPHFEWAVLPRTASPLF